MNKTFGVIGGDRRQAELAQLLEADGHTVYTYGVGGTGTGPEALDRAASAETVILPLPLCRGDGVLNCEESPMPTADLFRRFRARQLLLAGQVKPQQRREAEERGLRLEDYFLREELTVANAAATAEAAVQVAMERLDRTLLGMDCLVLGFGRIGKLLSHRLHGLGARVTATARKPGDLAWIRAYGWRALETGSPGRTSGWFRRGVQHGPLPGPGRTAAVPAAQGLPVRGFGLGPGDRPDHGGSLGAALGLGPLPAGAAGAPHRGGGHPGRGLLHYGRTR